MGNKIIDSGKPARRIVVSGKPQRRIDPEAFAAALGAEPIGEAHAPNLDPVSLAALDSELIKRLRSSGRSAGRIQLLVALGILVPTRRVFG
jgi:hypothetical protein